MLVRTSNSLVYYGGVLLILCTLYFQLYHDFLNVVHGIFYKMIYFTNKTLLEELRYDEIDLDAPISLPFLLMEIIILNLTIFFLRKIKSLRGQDRLDELLEECKEALRQTNMYLEKWRIRRASTEYSYLDDESQEMKPVKLEVPILHMAIIDTLGTTRSKPERGDAGDTVNIIDSTVLSVTSLIDDDMDSVITDDDKVSTDEIKNIELKYRYLWDVIEED